MICIDEPEESVTEKLEVLMTIDWITALEPVMLRVYPPTEMLVLVVNVTSLNAAKANVGRNNNPRNRILSFFIEVKF